MDLLLFILMPSLWLLFSMIEGTREGYLYAYRDAKDPGYDKDLHPLFFMQRIVIVTGFVMPFILISKWYLLPIAIVSWALVFPLVHDGFYYMTRNALDKNVYPDGFMTNKNTSTAKFSVESAFIRIFMAMAACVLYGVYIHLITK